VTLSNLGNLINRQRWLEPAEKVLAAIAGATVNQASQPVRNFLHGTWLRHPLHSVVTDLPVGAWSVAAVLDCLECLDRRQRYTPGSDAAVGIGLLGALVAAASGLCDWDKTDPPARRVGVLHALFNLSATACYSVSWLQRRRGNRAEAMASGMIGFLLITAGTYLGGYLSYEERIGVDHAQRGEGPKNWTPVMAETELSESQPRRVSAEGIDILLVKLNGRLFAIGEKCAHLGGPLAEGELEGNAVVCPWHGSRFSLEDGRVLDGPALYPQSCYEARVREGQIEVRGAEASSR
jgi:nitrite reductase/ring-hydroxylating ferredoxin subunit/uncharacterized membrane protein